MTRVMKARKGGFTLVELLIVIMIIAILAGMLLLATGSATDSAEATKIINDLRNMKSAALMYFVDHNEWPFIEGATDVTVDASADLMQSLANYLDRPLDANYDSPIVTAKTKIATKDNSTAADSTELKVLFGLKPKILQQGVKDKLKSNASKSGLYTATGTFYTGATDTIFVVIK